MTCTGWVYMSECRGVGGILKICDLKSLTWMMGSLCARWWMIMMGSFTDDDDDGWLWWWVFFNWLDKGCSGAGSNWSQWVSESGGSKFFFICRKFMMFCCKIWNHEEIDSPSGWTWMNTSWVAASHMIMMIWHKYLWHHHPTHGQVTHTSACLWHHHPIHGWVKQVLVTSSSMSWMSDTSACDDIIIDELHEQHKCSWQHHHHHHRWVAWATQVLVTTSSSSLMSWMTDTSACDDIIIIHIIIHELDEQHLWWWYHHPWVFWMYFWHEVPLLKRLHSLDRQ